MKKFDYFVVERGFGGCRIVIGEEVRLALVFFVIRLRSAIGE